MALIKCRECGNEVSSEANACPKCGARVVVPKVKSKTTKRTWFIAGLLGLAVVAVGVSTENQENERRAAAAAKTPAQKEADAKENQRVLMAVAMVKTIRETARNPQSIQWVDIYSNEDGSAVCVDMRAQNGFGGMSRERWVSANGKLTDAAAIWNKRCVGKNFHDMKAWALKMADRL